MKYYDNTIMPSKTLTGFTLIEVLLYSCIVVILIGGLMLALYAMMESTSATHSRIELAENMRFANQKIAWVVKGADTITTPAVGSKSSQLILSRKIGGTSTQVAVQKDDGTIMMRRGANPSVPLTNGWVRAASLSFEAFALSGATRESIRVKGALVSIDALHPATESFDFFVTIQ